MADNFLSNNGYYNKGGLNGKPKEPRPMPPKGQQSNNKYELIFRQLIHERNELRKYIIDICNLLGIDTSQSILGANCLEFYAVLSSVAEDKIKDLQEQLKHKEQELRNIYKAFDIEYIIDKETGSIIGRCNKLNKKEQECEELKKELQAQRAFTTQEQRKIYCVAYDETCETGNECKQKECVFKDRLKYKQALNEIEKYLDAQQKYFDGEDYHNLLNIINSIKE